jgi:hypothetical protein
LETENSEQVLVFLLKICQYYCILKVVRDRQKHVSDELNGPECVLLSLFMDELHECPFVEYLHQNY